MPSTLEAGTAYHAHLDECEQCREHPFAQCPEGARLLLAVGEAATGISGATLRYQGDKPKPRKPRRRKKKRGSQRRKRR